MWTRATAMLVLAGQLLTPSAEAFCGFYVAKADAELFNQASRVVLVRSDDKTVITMANDYEGDLDEFAMVVPVPELITRDQIHVGDPAVLDHLDAYSAPRLVEYFDSDPCRVVYERDMALMAEAPTAGRGGRPDELGKALGVTIEASYTVGEYDILILSAAESDGLVTWLTANDYRIPDGAERVLDGYIKQDMRFFVAKVNLGEQRALGVTNLRPLQIAYESRKFMLPIRLGVVNANGPQDLILYTLTRDGRVETTNYRTVRLPSDQELPEFVEAEFDDFYRDMFARQVARERGRAVFLEYAWNMSWCDPCAADPLSRDELRSLGVFWLDDGDVSLRPRRGGGPQNVFVTRLHVRYDAEHFPDDLFLQETGDSSNFQGRYILRHPWTGDATCDAAREYRKQLRDRQEREAETLASLTGWNLDDIYDRIDLADPMTPGGDVPWYKKLWRN